MRGLMMLALLFVAHNASAEELKSWGLSVKGWTQVFYVPEDGVSQPPQRIRLGDDDLQWTSLRVLSTLTTGTKFSFFTDIEVIDFDNTKNANWVRHAEVRYQFNPDWVLRVGRTALSLIFAPPPTFLIETVRRPRVPFPVFGYAVQTEGNLGNGWKLTSDISSRSAVPFDSGHNWDHLEVSSRLQKQINPKLSLAATAQLSQGFSRFVTDFGYKPTPRWYLKGAIYTFNEEKADTQGAYTFTGYKVMSWAELHTMVDFQNRNPTTTPSKDSLVWTNGVRLFTLKDANQLSLIVDHEAIVDGPQEDRFLARVQARF